LIFDARVHPAAFRTVAPPDGTATFTLVAPEPVGTVQANWSAYAITLFTEDVIAKYREWSKRGVLSSSRLD